jgi:hypothetical protein
MNITNARPKSQLPAPRRNRPGNGTVVKRFLIASAGALLLLAATSRGTGGCIDDPCKFPSMGYLFESNPSYYHRHDDASQTFTAPCYGYHPTCWRQWPGCCVGYPPPANPVPNDSRPVPLPKLPPAEVVPTPDAAPPARQPPIPALPAPESAIPPLPAPPTQ